MKTFGGIFPEINNVNIQGNVCGQFSGEGALSRENVDIPVYDYKSLLLAVMFCATLVRPNTDTDTHTDRETASDRLYDILGELS